ncbi:hypothetical protein [Paenibacillus sp. GCM10023250]|uniref:hypothetical protein n=1 Tax=Paenibacillus sp. GCM10023250 TaxID=3252648 RepID=UPI003618371F
MKYILTVLVACLVIWYPTDSIVAADVWPDSKLKRLEAESGHKLEIHWDVTTQTPSLITGALSKPSRHTPAWIALEFVNKHRGLYGIQSPHSVMQVVEISGQRASVNRVRVQHMLYKTPVWGDELRIDIDENGVIQRVEGRIHPNLAKATFNRPHHAAISQEKAIRVAAASLDQQHIRLDQADVQPYYLPSRAGIPLVFSVTFQSSSQTPMRVMVHALTGKVISQ